MHDYDVSKIPAADVLSSSVPPSQLDKHRGLKRGRGAATEGIKSNLQISTSLSVNLVSLGESVPMRESGASLVPDLHLSGFRPEGVVTFL